MSAEVPSGTLVIDRHDTPYIVTASPAHLRGGGHLGEWEYCDLAGRRVTPPTPVATLWRRHPDAKQASVAWVQGKLTLCVWPELQCSRWIPDADDLMSANAFAAGNFSYRRP